METTSDVDEKTWQELIESFPVDDPLLHGDPCFPDQAVLDDSLFNEYLTTGEMPFGSDQSFDFDGTIADRSSPACTDVRKGHPLTPMRAWTTSPISVLHLDQAGSEMQNTESPSIEAPSIEALTERVQLLEKTIATMLHKLKRQQTYIEKIQPWSFQINSLIYDLDCRTRDWSGVPQDNQSDTKPVNSS